ncbi:MAG: hypothetical protein FWF49_02215 [Oscillospiraceae bacterium]|nr:hypothetical protein [Oscillospiraceae bacterium]
MGENKVKADFLLKKCIGAFIEATLSIGQLDGDRLEDVILKKIDESKPLRDLYVDFVDSLIYIGLDLSTIVPGFFEQIYNTTHDATGKGQYNENDFEFFNYFIWEIFICTIAILLYYERFSEIYLLWQEKY